MNVTANEMAARCARVAVDGTARGGALCGSGWRAFVSLRLTLCDDMEAIAECLPRDDHKLFCLSAH